MMRFGVVLFFVVCVINLLTCQIRVCKNCFVLACFKHCAAVSAGNTFIAQKCPDVQLCADLLSQCCAPFPVVVNYCWFHRAAHQFYVLDFRQKHCYTL